MDDDTTGALLYRFLKQHNLHLLADYESHDIKHALLGYPANEEGEACLQYFFWGNGLRSFPVWITVMVTLFVMPEYHGSFRKAYERGKITPDLQGTDWFGLITKPFDSVIQQLNIPPQ